MIIDETAGSGGDLLPWMWRKFKMGPLVGKRTWGGLVGDPRLPGADGRRVGDRAEPGHLDRRRLGGGERSGVPPDIEVEQTPADVIAGKDPQLEKAIQVVLDELKKAPPKTPARPPYRDIRKEIKK